MGLSLQVCVEWLKNKHCNLTLNTQMSLYPNMHCACISMLIKQKFLKTLSYDSFTLTVVEDQSVLAINLTGANQNN